MKIVQKSSFNMD